MQPLSLRALRTLRTHLPARIPIIGCGGIASGADALEFARAGCTAVQLYTSFGYDGVGAPRRIKDELAALLRAEGTTWAQVVRAAVESTSLQELPAPEPVRPEEVTVAQLVKEAEELKGALAHRASPELGFEDPDEQPTPGDTYGEAWIPAEQDPDGNRQFWRMMRAWDKETTAAPTGAPDGFISTLARLYGKIMAGRRDREACDCASWLARQLETAPRAPVALVGDTLRRFAREPGMRDRVDDVWSLMFGLGIWQVAKVLERRWPNQAPEKEVWEAVSVVTSDCRSDFRELISLFIDDQESDRLKAALRGRNESTSSSATEVRLELTELTEVKWRYFKPQDIAFLVVPPHPYIWVVDLGEITIRLVHNNRGCFAGAYGYLLRALEVEVDIQVSSEDLADIHSIFDHLCY